MAEDAEPDRAGKSHEQTRSRARDLFDLFRHSTEVRFGNIKSWSLQTAQTCCRQALWDDFAKFLLHEYKIEKGQRNEGRHLGVGTLLDYFGALLNQAKARFLATGDDSVKIFFTCLDKNAGTEQAKWLRKLKEEIVRKCFERAKEDGEELDNSVVPIYLQHIEAMAAVLGRRGTPEAAMRKLGIKTLWRSGGRASEAGWLNWDNIYWDDFFECAFIDVLQTKVAKLKKIALIAGNCRQSCWFLDLADHLALGSQSEYKVDEASWLFPELQAVKQPGTKLGSWMKALVIGGSTEYDPCDELPVDICAGSVRPGVCNMLATMMPAEFVVHTTGHELKNAMSSLWEYIDAHLSLCIPGALPLAGWQPLPWGQLGKGPTPASIQILRTLLVSSGTDVDKLEDLIDLFFQIDTASAPSQRRGGELRSLIRAAFATFVMYFEERLDAGEMHANGADEARGDCAQGAQGQQRPRDHHRVGPHDRHQV